MVDYSKWADLVDSDEERENAKAKARGTNTKSMMDDALVKLHKDHYIDIYTTRNRETRQYFAERDPKRLYTTRLEDPEKWTGLAAFLGLDPSKAQDVHENKSPARAQ